MDMQMMSGLIDWIQRNVGDRTSKSELMQKAQSANLPADARSMFQDLPEGEHSKESVISMLRDKVAAGIGGRGGGGGMGGMFGG